MVRRPLTDRQREIYEFIRDSLQANHNMPTYRMVATRLGYANPSGAWSHIAALIRKGWLEDAPGHHGGYRLTGTRIVLEAIEQPRAPIGAPNLEAV